MVLLFFIPNREVKTASADGTVCRGQWESIRHGEQGCRRFFKSLSVLLVRIFFYSLKRIVYANIVISDFR